MPELYPSSEPDYPLEYTYLKYHVLLRALLLAAWRGPFRDPSGTLRSWTLLGALLLAACEMHVNYGPRRQVRALWADEFKASLSLCSAALAGRVGLLYGMAVNSVSSHLRL